jgi:Cupin
MAGRRRIVIVRPRRRAHTDPVDLDPWAPKVPLGEALHVLRMNGAYYCRSELTAPWGITMPPMAAYMWFHVVTHGGCRLEVDEGEACMLRPGDLALVPRGQGHVVRSDPGAPAPSVLDLPLEQVSDRYEILRHGGGGARTTLVCGAVRFHHPAARDLGRLMPAIIYVESAGALDSEWMQATLGLMASEAQTLRPGGETVITRLGCGRGARSARR